MPDWSVLKGMRGRTGNREEKNILSFAMKGSSETTSKGQIQRQVISVFFICYLQHYGLFSLIQSLSHVWHFATTWLQHARLHCPPPTPGASSNSCPSSWWCHPTVSSSVVPFSSHLQSFPASESFQISQFFASHGQSIGVSASASVNEYSGLISFRIDWFDLLVVQGTLKSLLQHHSSKASILQCSAFFIVQLSYLYMTTGKTIALTRRTFVGKGMSLLFNMLSRLVITFLPRSKHLLISWLQSPSAVILEPKKIESVTVSIVSPSICHKVMGPDAVILVFECWVLSQLFHSLLSFSPRSSSVPFNFLP